LAANTATTDGGGIYNGSGGTVVVRRSTLSTNAVTLNTGLGGAVVNLATMSVANSLLSNNSAPSGGGIYNNGTAMALTNSTLRGPLGHNGGPTKTQALLPSSPAIDRGGTGTNGCPTVDQRGMRRPQGRACDIGAYERM